MSGAWDDHGDKPTTPVCRWDDIGVTVESWSGGRTGCARCIGALLAARAKVILVAPTAVASFAFEQ